MSELITLPADDLFCKWQLLGGFAAFYSTRDCLKIQGLGVFCSLFFFSFFFLTIYRYFLILQNEHCLSLFLPKLFPLLSTSSPSLSPVSKVDKCQEKMEDSGDVYFFIYYELYLGQKIGSPSFVALDVHLSQPYLLV